jgi:hypothetical protein
MTDSANARPRTFRLIRDIDANGVSGTGEIADGCAWPDGTVSVRWRGVHPSIVYWQDLAAVEAVHGHGGDTRLAWDNLLVTPPDLRAVEGRLMDALQGDVESWDANLMTDVLWKVVRDVQPLLAEVASLRTQAEHAGAVRDENGCEADRLRVLLGDVCYLLAAAGQDGPAAVYRRAGQVDDAPADPGAGTVEDVLRGQLHRAQVDLDHIDRTLREAGIAWPGGREGVEDLARMVATTRGELEVARAGTAALTEALDAQAAELVRLHGKDTEARAATARAAQLASLLKDATECLRINGQGTVADVLAGSGNVA